MRCVICATLLTAGWACFGEATPAQADPGWYPRVRTFSGGYYGPTQAHYQYQRRYGRPWHGYNGLYGGAAVGAVNGFPAFGHGAVIGGWAFPSFGYYGYGVPFGFSDYSYNYSVFSPIWGSPFGLPSPWSGFASPPFSVFGSGAAPLGADGVVGAVPVNPVLGDAWDENLKQWQQPLELMPIIAAGKPALPASTPQARIRSIQLQDQGDRRLREADFLLATRRYREAISAAPDRAEPHLHLTFALLGIKQFEDAIQEFKVGLALDPSWPESGVNLDVILGEENLIAKMQLKQRVAEWTLLDVRDPDRLFLLGALLYLDNDAQRGRLMLDTAARLGGMHEHLAVFLNQPAPAALAGAQGAPQNADDDPAPANQAPELDLPALPPLPDPPKTRPSPPPSPDEGRFEQSVPQSIPGHTINGPSLPQ